MRRAFTALSPRRQATERASSPGILTGGGGGDSSGCCVRLPALCGAQPGYLGPCTFEAGMWPGTVRSARWGRRTRNRRRRRRRSHRSPARRRSWPIAGAAGGGRAVVQVPLADLWEKPQRRRRWRIRLRWARCCGPCRVNRPTAGRWRARRLLEVQTESGYRAWVEVAAVRPIPAGERPYRESGPLLRVGARLANRLQRRDGDRRKAAHGLAA